MDQVIGTLIYRITGDTSSLDSSLQQSGTRLRSLQDDLQKSQTYAGSLGTAFTKLASLATRSFSAIKALQVTKALASAAGEAQALEAKFNTVFDGIQNETNAWIRQYASATNRGVEATKSFISTLQDIETGYGRSREEAAKFSEAAVAVANDLATFSGMNINQDMEDLLSGFNGIFRGLRSIGVSLTEEIINQQEYAQSLGKTYEQMTLLEKREAVLSGVMKQSPNAIHQNISSWRDYNYELGSATVSSGNYMNTTEGLRQNLRDLKAELGAQLLPALNGVAGVTLDLVHGFNSLDGAVQNAIVALGAFAATAALVGGPVGVVVGAIAAASIVFNRQTDSSEELVEATGMLSSETAKYSGLVKQLSGDISGLTEAELELLQVRRDITALKIQEEMDALIGHMESYNSVLDANKGKQEQAANSVRVLQAALHDLKTGGTDSLDAIMAELVEAGQDKYSDMSDLVRSWREAVSTGAVTESDIVAELLSSQKTLSEVNSEVAKSQVPVKEGILAVAQAVNAGAISVEEYKDTLPELYNEVMKVAQALKQKKSAAEEASAADKAYTSKDWQTQLKETQEAIAEENGEYQKAYSLRSELIAAEQRDAIGKLAAEVGVEGDLTAMNEAELRSRILAVKGADAELAALDEYYNQKRITSRRQYDENLKALDDAATNEAQKRATDEKAALDDLLNKRLQNWSETKGMLDRQTKASKEAAASELEQNGMYEEAYQVRLNLLKKERDEALSDMEWKVLKGEATEDALNNLRTYYANEEVRLEQEKDDKIAKAADQARKEQERLDAEAARAAEEQAERTKQAVVNAIQEVVSQAESLMSALNSLYSNQTDAAVSAIDEQTRAQEEALGIAEQSTAEKLQQEYEDAVKAGDMELAQEKQRDLQRQQIEDEAEERKKKLQREQAKRDKELSIFQTILNTASAVVRFLADPGGFPGVALSAVAATTGALQLAAIQAQPLPSYDVGAEKILQDQIAMVHKGETILPEPMAEAVRRGDAVYGQGGTGVIVEINNYSTSKVTADESADPDGSRRILVTIGKAVTSGIENGTYDRALSSRYGITRRGTNA